MKLLLDTHTLFWWDVSPSQLSKRVRDLLNSADNLLLVSAASIWELQIKQQLGKLELRLPLTEMIRTQQDENGIVIIPVEVSHVLELDTLPLHHRDPFDRILIAQSRIEGAELVSRDSVFGQYDVKVVW